MRRTLLTMMLIATLLMPLSAFTDSFASTAADPAYMALIDAVKDAEDEETVTALYDQYIASDITMTERSRIEYHMARYFKDIHGMVQHMKKHADIMRPKFEAVIHTLEREIGGLGIGSWLAPRGGYFISFDSMPGCAKKIVAKAKEAGLIMTEAGATFPYGKDPQDSNIRIAPSYPTAKELKVATEIFVLSVKLVSIDKILESK